MTWSKPAGASLYQACIFRTDETEALHCEVTTNDSITFTGIPGGFGPGVDYQVGLTAYPGYLLQPEAYEGIDLNDPLYWADLQITDLTYSVDGGAAKDAAECIGSDLGSACAVDIGSVSDTIIFNGTLAVTIPSFMGDEAWIGYDKHNLDRKIAIPLNLKFMGDF